MEVVDEGLADLFQQQKRENIHKWFAFSVMSLQAHSYISITILHDSADPVTFIQLDLFGRLALIRVMSYQATKVSIIDNFSSIFSY